MSVNDKDDATLRQARAELERAADQLDELTLARLRAARLCALEAAETRRPWRLTSWALPLSSAAVATLVAVTVTLLWTRAPDPTAPGNIVAASNDDLDLVVTKESPDLFNEQLEF